MNNDGIDITKETAGCEVERHKSLSSTVILGGGFGGLAAANALRTLLPAEHHITVVDQSADFVVGAGKTWLMLGSATYAQVSNDRKRLLEPGINLLSETVHSIYVANRTVSTDTRKLRWDNLVIALGAAQCLSSLQAGKLPL